MTRPQSPRLFMAVLIGATALGPFAMQIFLPSLPAIQDGFAVSPGTAQLTLSLSMFAIAVSTLAYGPLSDRLGRRPVLIAGLGLFLAGSAMCALAPDIQVLIAGRLLQAGGGAAGMVLARAIVRDVYGRERAANMIAYLTMAMVVAPMVAPALGGIVNDLVGWRMNFVLAGFFGAAVAGLVVFGLAETLTDPEPTRGVFHMLGGFGRLLREPAFLGYAFQAAFTAATFFAFLSGAPYVMVKVLGRPATEYGLYFVMAALGYIAGNFAAAKLSHIYGLERMIVTGSVGALLAALLLGALLLAGFRHPLAIFVPTTVMAFFHGLSLPNAQAGAVSVDPKAAGAASGLVGFLQMTLAAVVAQAVGSMQDGTPYPMAGFIAGSSALALGAITVGLWLCRNPRRP